MTTKQRRELAQRYAKLDSDSLFRMFYDSPTLMQRPSMKDCSGR